MNRSELVNAVAEKTDTPRTQVKAVLAATLDQIMAATATGEKVILAVFGTFEGSNRAAREGRNPATGEPLQIAASRGVGFKAGTAFKQHVAGAVGSLDLSREASPSSGDSGHDRNPLPSRPARSVPVASRWVRDRPNRSSFPMTSVSPGSNCSSRRD